MMRVVLLAMSALLLANCGIQRPLIPPKDIPAYEEQRRKKRAQLEEDMRNYEQKTKSQEQQAPAAAPKAE